MIMIILIIADQKLQINIPIIPAFKPLVLFCKSKPSDSALSSLRNESSTNVVAWEDQAKTTIATRANRDILGTAFTEAGQQPGRQMQLQSDQSLVGTVLGTPSCAVGHLMIWKL